MILKFKFYVVPFIFAHQYSIEAIKAQFKTFHLLKILILYLLKTPRVNLYYILSITSWSLNSLFFSHYLIRDNVILLELQSPMLGSKSRRILEGKKGLWGKTRIIYLLDHQTIVHEFSELTTLKLNFLNRAMNLQVTRHY